MLVIAIGLAIVQHLKCPPECSNGNSVSYPCVVKAVTLQVNSIRTRWLLGSCTMTIQQLCHDTAGDLSLHSNKDCDTASSKMEMWVAATPVASIVSTSCTPSYVSQHPEAQSARLHLCLRSQLQDSEVPCG